MLIQFRVENHRSLRDEQILSMVATKLGDAADQRLLPAAELGEALLPAVAIYGANASGKTNVLHSLAFMCRAVRRSHRQWEPETGPPREPFMLSGRQSAPSLYEMDIRLEGVRYRYGFVLGETRVEEEWLYAWPRKRKQTWFTREGDNFEFGKRLVGENETIQRVTRSNSLFLSAAAQNNHPQLRPLFRWFQAAHFELHRSRVTRLLPNRLTMLRPDAQGSLFPEDESIQQSRASIVRLLQAADIGILDVKIEPGRRDHHGVPILDLLFLHKTEGPGVWLPLEAESAGTITLLEIATQLVEVLQSGGFLCIDELEASLHPVLALELLRLFHDREHNPRGAQLIFTTHDTNLLGNVLGEPPLRRDQIWFTEKDNAGATHLYPLTDFHPRKEENLERGYLQGRYGAMPFLGDLLAPLVITEDP